MDVIELIVMISLINGFIWGLFFWWRGVQMRRIRAQIEQSGETWVLPPHKVFFQGFRGPVSVKTMGAMGLLADRLIFIPPLGRLMVYPLKDIVALSEDTWFHGNYRNGHPFLILKLADGKEVGFQVGEQQRWVEEIRSRIGV